MYLCKEARTHNVMDIKNAKNHMEGPVHAT